MSKKVPEFRSTEEERAYWAETSPGESGGLKRNRNKGSSRLKLPEKTIYLRMPGSMMEELRVQAHLMDVPQQSLIKTYIAERMEREMRKERSRGRK
jgi:hypothetical protein